MSNPLIPQIIALALTGTLALISALHLYWVGGGKWGLATAIPTGEDGTPLFSPRPLATLAVALGLGIGALLALERGFLWPGWIPPQYLGTGCWIFAAAFAARTVGDFRHIGLFRRVRGTTFARFDGMLFTPLCALLSLGFLALLSW